MSASTIKPNKPGILVVDHDGQSLQETRAILEGQGFRVYTASDGLAALEEFKRQQPIMVILAAMLPKLHGFEVCKSIKKSTGGANVPVIITTKLNKNEKYKRQAMQKFKADDFLVKPLSQEKLLGLVKQHLGKSGGGGGERPAGDRGKGGTGRSGEANLERILEDTLAGLMRGEGSSAKLAENGLIRRGDQPDRDPRWDAQDDDEEDWGDLDDESVVPSMPAALADVDEDEIDRIVDGLDFFADEVDAVREEPALRALESRPSRGVPARPQAGAGGSAPVVEEEDLARRTVAVTPVEMARSAPSPQEGARPTVAVTPVEMSRGAAASQPAGGMTDLDPVGEGSLFGKYLLIKKIATGGMAEVFRAKHVGVEGFEKLVALKRILPHLTDNEEFIKMFIDEGKLAAQLTHTNIVQIYELGEVQRSYYIAMEYVHGKNLKQVLHRAKQINLPMTIEKAVTIASKICKALDYAHRKCDMANTPLNLVHRDVSPQNILISYEGEVKLVDFGIAKAASQASITRAGALKGKILYMSPEQAWGKPIDHRSDIYSVGNLLYEMVTDRKLFAGQTEVEILKKVRDPKIVPPSQHAKDMPSELEKIILKALEVDPENRYQDAGSMKRALDKYLFKRKVALGALNLGSYVQNLFQDEFQQDTVETLAQVDLPSLVLTNVDTDEESGQGEDPEASGQVAVRGGREGSGRTPARGRRSQAEEKKDEGPNGGASDMFDRTRLSPQGAPTWLYVMILAVVLLVGVLLYLLLARPSRTDLTTEAEETTLQPKDGLEAQLPQVQPTDMPLQAGAVSAVGATDVLFAAETPRTRPAEIPAEVPATVEQRELVAAVPEAVPTPQPPPMEVPTPRPPPTEKPTSTPKPSPTERPTKTPRPTKTQKGEPAAAPAAAGPTADPEPVAGAARPSNAEVIYGETGGSSEDSSAGTVVIKRAEPRATPVPSEDVPAPPREQIYVPKPTPVPPEPTEPAAAEAEAEQPAQPVRENDLVEFPDTQLEFVEQGTVTITADVRRKLKRALGKDTLNVRFFARAEISIKGQVTSIEGILRGAKDVPQMASILDPSELAKFDAAFTEAAKSSKFKPLMKDGVKVRSVQTIFLQVRVP